LCFYLVLNLYLSLFLCLCSLSLSCTFSLHTHVCMRACMNIANHFSGLKSIYLWIGHDTHTHNTHARTIMAMICRPDQIWGLGDNRALF
jgi:hypothetical protein